MQIIIEGWRFLSQSYAIVNQFQLLEMLKHPDLELYHQDVPYWKEHWQSITGLFPETAEITLKQIKAPPPNCSSEATYRIFWPYNFTPSNSKRTYIFGTTEWGVFEKFRMEELNISSLAEVHHNLDIIIITPSQWSRQGFIRSGAQADRVVVIPLGVDPSIYQPLAEDQRKILRQEFNLENNFVFLNIGGMISVKGITPLLKAFAVVVDKYPQARLIFKGLDNFYSYKECLLTVGKTLFSDRQLNQVMSHILYIGNHLAFSEMARLYQIADAYVSPHLGAGFNLPVLEAIACGLPVISTQGSSTDDFTDPEFALAIESKLESSIIDDQTRFYLNPNVDHLIALMLQVIEQPSFGQNAHHAGPKFVSERFTWKHTVDQLLTVIKSSGNL